MRIVVFGASGKIGREVVRQAVMSGHVVRAFVRTPGELLLDHENLTLVRGDVQDSEAVSRAVEGVDAVISALGPTPSAPMETLEHGMRNIVAAMEAQGVSRIVVISGAGVDAPGDRKAPVHRLMSIIVKRLARPGRESKQREFDALRSSDAQWTAVRPPMVVDGPARGRTRVGLRTPPGIRITRADLASFMIALAASRAYVRKAPFVSN